MAKKYNKFLPYMLSVPLIFSAFIWADNTDTTPKALDIPQTESTDKKTMIWFRYKDEPIITIVNDLAKKRNINIMLPQGPNTLTATFTFSLPHKITIEKAWQYMITILDISGYALVPHEEFSCVVKNDKNVNKEMLPLYVNTPPEDLPNTDLKIRYLRYLSYLQVPGASGSIGTDGLKAVLDQMLSENYTVIYEPELNALMITDTARMIKSAMEIINELDGSPKMEKPEFIKLKHTTASQVQTILQTLISGQSNSGSAGSGSTQPSSSSYFSKDTKMVADNRLNTLILIGKQEALARIKDFIETYIDVPQDDGRSIIHIYDLQYLNAESFAPILAQIVADQGGGGGGSYGSGTGQSSSSGTSSEYRQFQGVKIAAEAGDGGGSDSGGSQTGNRLVIAALKDDWIRIEQLIKELDKPQLQVIIHALIVDMTYDAIKEFANQVRNHSDMFIKGLDWQTGHIAGIENKTSSSSSSPTEFDALQANLLPSTSTSGSGNIASNATSGTFILSFKDKDTNGIWWVSKALNSHTDSTILSQPFLMTMNNKQVSFEDTATRRLAGAADQKFGVEVATQEDVNATLNVTILPRVNENGNINMTLKIDVNQFTGTSINTQTNRTVTTNVNIQDKDILVLGGLTKTKIEHTVYKTPLLADMPGLGHLFKNRKKVVTKTNLMIFLRPEIVRLDNKAIQKRFYEKAEKILGYDDENFAYLRDPITRMFFGKDHKGATPQVLEKFRGDVEVIAHHVDPRTEAIPMPSLTLQHKEEKRPIDETPAKQVKYPSEQPPVDPDEQERKAAEELKRLFNFEHNKKRQTPKTSLQPEKSNVVHVSHHHEHAPAEAVQAEQDFQDLFKDSDSAEEFMQNATL